MQLLPIRAGRAPLPILTPPNSAPQPRARKARVQPHPLDRPGEMHQPGTALAAQRALWIARLAAGGLALVGDWHTLGRARRLEEGVRAAGDVELVVGGELLQLLAEGAGGTPLVGRAGAPSAASTAQSSAGEAAVVGGGPEEALEVVEVVCALWTQKITVRHGQKFGSN